MDNTQTYQDDPLYFQAMECFQRGEWKNGLKYLSELMEIHTLEPELRSLNNEMQLRAHVDHDEVQDEQTLRRQRNRNWAARLGILFLVVLFVAISVRAYAGWIQSQFNTARLVVEEQAQQVELAVLYNNAQSLLAASRPQEANEILNQIEAAAPDFPYLPELRTRTDALLLLDEKYNQGVKLQAGGDFMSALVIFDDLQTQNPGYKDVESRLMEIQRTSVLNDLVKSANSAYEAGDWAQAVNDYEKLRSVDQAYQSADVEERLFRSYLNAAEDVLADPDGGMEAFEAANAYYRMALALRPQNQEVLTAQSNARVNIEERMIASYLRDAVRVLSDQGDSLDALKEAEKYFSQALAIRPNDPNLSNQVNFARLYLTAIQDFEKGRWTDVINKLLPVYTEEPDYADGTARQGLVRGLYCARRSRQCSRRLFHGTE
jgi:tetratricopeptide (TPR) repeat protein